jgi:hypothetical protein
LREALTKLLGDAAGTVHEEKPPKFGTVPAPTAPETEAGTKPAAPVPGRQELINRAADDLEEYQRLTAQGRYSEAGQRLESVRKSLEQLRGRKP